MWRPSCGRLALHSGSGSVDLRSIGASGCGQGNEQRHNAEVGAARETLHEGFVSAVAPLPASEAFVLERELEPRSLGEDFYALDRRGLSDSEPRRRLNGISDPFATGLRRGHAVFHRPGRSRVASSRLCRLSSARIVSHRRTRDRSVVMPPARPQGNDRPRRGGRQLVQRGRGRLRGLGSRPRRSRRR
jgi:hypothetical protein